MNSELINNTIRMVNVDICLGRILNLKGTDGEGRANDDGTINVSYDVKGYHIDVTVNESNENPYHLVMTAPDGKTIINKTVDRAYLADAVLDIIDPDYEKHIEERLKKYDQEAW